MSVEWVTPEQIRMRRAAEVMEGPLGTAIYEVVFWARKHWAQSQGDEIWLNPQDDGALTLIGGTLMGFPVCASVRVPRGEALIYRRMLGAYIRDGEEPERLDLLDVLKEAVDAASRRTEGVSGTVSGVPPRDDGDRRDGG